MTGIKMSTRDFQVFFFLFMNLTYSSFSGNYIWLVLMAMKLLFLFDYLLVFQPATINTDLI